MTTTTQTKRPDKRSNAGQAMSDPNPTKGLEMNAHSITTTAAIPTTTPLSVLIATHKAAQDVSDKCWTALSVLEDANPIEQAKVQYATRLHYVGGTSGEQRTPVYAFSLSELEAELCRMHRNNLLLFPATMHPKLTAQHEAGLAAMTAEYQRQVEAEQAARKACGITLATKKARAASAAVDVALKALITYDFTTVAEVQLVVFHLLACRNEGWESCDNNILLDFVKAIGRAAK